MPGAKSKPSPAPPALEPEPEPEVVMEEAPEAYAHYDSVLVETVQGRAIKIMFDVLRDIVQEIALTFTEHELRIECVNDRNNMYASVALAGERFEQYRVPAPFVVGLHPSAVHKLLKCVSAQDTIAFGVTSDRPDEMDVIIKNSARNMETTCSVTSLDLPELTIELEPKDYEFQATVKSILLKDVMRDLMQVGDIITIAGNPDKSIEFCARRQHMRERMKMGESKSLTVTRAPASGPVSVTFVSRFLALLTKAYATSPRVVINVGNALPLKLQYKIGDLGDMVLVLAFHSDEGE